MNVQGWCVRSEWMNVLGWCVRSEWMNVLGWWNEIWINECARRMEWDLNEWMC